MRAAFLIFLFTLSACSAGPTVKPGPERQAEAEELFEGTEACFLLYDLKAKSYEVTFNKKYCYERSAACSTFKLPLAVMAADAGLIKDKDTAFKWDGQEKGIDSWNEDQTAESWIKNSTVWVSQELTRKLGRKKVQAYLKKFSYGNRDFSGDLDAAWLTPAPFLDHGKREPRTSMKISPIEQVDFLESLWRDELPVKASAGKLARELSYLRETPNGFTLSGKTGSGFVGRDHDKRLGWFVAHVAGNGREYLAVTRFEDKEPADKDADFGGKRAREITEKLLRSAGLW
jgi:beta-lactamase class D